MALSFGVTVLPDPPYQRLVELMVLAESHGFEIRLDLRLARPLAGLVPDPDARRRGDLDDEVRPPGDEPRHPRPDGRRQPVRDAARHLGRAHGDGHRPRRLGGALHRPPARQGGRVRARPRDDQAVHERRGGALEREGAAAQVGAPRAARDRDVGRGLRPQGARRRRPRRRRRDHPARRSRRSSSGSWAPPARPPRRRGATRPRSSASCARRA